MAIDVVSTVLDPRPLSQFIETPAITKLTEHALFSIKTGHPIHFRGTTETVKPSLSYHLTLSSVAPWSGSISANRPNQVQGNDLTVRKDR